jgi:hypothetical protein
MPQNKQKRDESIGGEGSIRGLPGYRTRDNRSGLDPVDTPAEAAHMEGVFYRNIFTLRIRTRNKYYLALMVIFGPIIFTALATVSIYSIYYAAFYSSPAILAVLLGTTFTMLITGAITINLILNFLEMAGIIPDKNKPKPSPIVRKKNYPKRRKDYK